MEGSVGTSHPWLPVLLSEAWQGSRGLCGDSGVPPGLFLQRGFKPEFFFLGRSCF